MNKYFNANAVLSLFAKNYMELKKDLPIRPSEMGVLNIITETVGPHTPLKLAELLCVSKPMITALINSLIAKGYVFKEPCIDDRRAYYVKPTDKGVELVNIARIDMDKYMDRLISGLGNEEFDTFIILATKANNILENKGE